MFSSQFANLDMDKLTLACRLWIHAPDKKKKKKKKKKRKAKNPFTPETRFGDFIPGGGQNSNFRNPWLAFSPNMQV